MMETSQNQPGKIQRTLSDFPRSLFPRSSFQRSLGGSHEGPSQEPRLRRNHQDTSVEDLRSRGHGELQRACHMLHSCHYLVTVSTLSAKTKPCLPPCSIQSQTPTLSKGSSKDPSSQRSQTLGSHPECFKPAQKLVL